MQKLLHRVRYAANQFNTCKPFCTTCPLSLQKFYQKIYRLIILSSYKIQIFIVCGSLHSCAAKWLPCTLGDLHIKHRQNDIKGECPNHKLFLKTDPYVIFSACHYNSQTPKMDLRCLQVNSYVNDLIVFSYDIKNDKFYSLVPSNH